MTRSLPFQAVILTSVAVGALCAGGGIAQAQFKQTNLVSDISGLATITDSNLVNTWGVSAIPGALSGSLTRARARSSLFTVTGSTGVAAANVFPGPRRRTSWPSRGGGGPARTDRAGRKFGHAPLTLAATGPAAVHFRQSERLNFRMEWIQHQSPRRKTPRLSWRPPSGALYTGLTINSAGNLLYAANGAGPASIDVFNGSFAATTAPGGFVDPIPLRRTRPLQRGGHRRQGLRELTRRPGTPAADKRDGGHGSGGRFR